MSTVVLALAVLLGGCGSDPTSPSTSDPGPPSTRPPASTCPRPTFVDLTGEAAPEVDALDNVFKAKYIEVAAGATVTFRNDGRNTHNLLPVSEGAFPPLEAEAFEPGTEAEITFDGARRLRLLLLAPRHHHQGHGRRRPRPPVAGAARARRTGPDPPTASPVAPRSRRRSTDWSDGRSGSGGTPNTATSPVSPRESATGSCTSEHRRLRVHRARWGWFGRGVVGCVRGTGAARSPVTSRRRSSVR